MQFSEQSRKWVKKLTELSEKGLYKGLLVSNDVDTNGWDEAFLRVFKKIHTFREDSRLSTWLHRITVNLCLNLKRRWRRRFKWRHQTIEGSETADHLEPGTDDYYPEALYQRKELEGMLWKKLRELPEQARAAFVLKELEGLSYDEIAKILKIKKGTVSSRLFYARKRLKELLEPYLSDS
ncbi:MAG: sigma-70 family RNA polymerase sigma factor [Deltaproteobacteria bacterium]|nr:sigma-70 family RNA polymerase sigma factor [Deltaproteobacteria bacterium]